VYIDRAQPASISKTEAKLMMARIFDATRHIDGLPPLREQPMTTPPTVVLPPAGSAAAHGQLVTAGLEGQGTRIAVHLPVR
jgi:hypothetical protein